MKSEESKWAEESDNHVCGILRRIDADIVKFKYDKDGVKTVFPAHQFVSTMKFKENEEEEAELVHFIAVVAEKNGLSTNDVMHLFPVILRILKSEIEWSK